jgi:hypothetical protein
MQQPGRKSTAALSVIPRTAIERPLPPEGLSEAEAALWNRVTATKPPEWFLPDVLPVLAGYVRASIKAEAMAAALAKFKGVPVNPIKFRRYMEINKAHDQAERLVATMGTKLRLTPQSRYTSQAAATAQAKTKVSDKPWEFGKSG